VNVENVVKPPSTPTPRNGRRYRLGGHTSIKKTTRAARNRLPETFSRNVPHGKPPDPSGTARLTACRMLPPRAPPTEIASMMSQRRGRGGLLAGASTSGSTGRSSGGSGAIGNETSGQQNLTTDDRAGTTANDLLTTVLIT
jgi:hypothetical protein